MDLSGEYAAPMLRSRCPSQTLLSPASRRAVIAKKKNKGELAVTFNSVRMLTQRGVQSKCPGVIIRHITMLIVSADKILQVLQYYLFLLSMHPYHDVKDG